MNAKVIRADYAALIQVTGTFGLQAEQVRQTLQQVNRDMDGLQSGDWLGRGAQAFYAEMNGQVLPSMTRLARALEAAGDVTRQISQIVQQAEAEAAAYLRLAGNGAIGPAELVEPAASGVPESNGAGALGEAMPGNVSALRSPGPGGGGAGGQAHSKTLLERLAAADPRFYRRLTRDKNLLAKLRRLERAGWIVEIAPKDKSDVLSNVQPGPPPKLILNGKRALEAFDGAANEILYGDIKLMEALSPKLAAQAMKDPILMERLRQMDKAGWKISVGKEPGSSAFEYSKKSLRLDPKQPLTTLKQGVKYVVRGPELEEEPRFEIKNQTEKESRSTYMAANRAMRLQHDAAELLSYYQAYEAAHGKLPDLLPFTTNGQRSVNAKVYEDFYRGVKNGTIDRNRAIKYIAHTLQEEPSGISNTDKYRDYYLNKWDAVFGESDFAREQVK